MSELDVWEIDAKFSFLEHQASTGENVPLIKDWKDVLNKVGDNQVLLQSIKGAKYFFSPLVLSKREKNMLILLS